MVRYLIAGVVGAGVGAALWEFLLKPAPLGSPAYVGPTDKSQNLIALFDRAKIPWFSHTLDKSQVVVLVKRKDLERAYDIVAYMETGKLPAYGIP